MKRSRMKNTVEADGEGSEDDSDIDDEYSNILFDDGEMDESRQDESSAGLSGEMEDDESDSDSLDYRNRHDEDSNDDSFDSDLYLQCMDVKYANLVVRHCNWPGLPEKGVLSMRERIASPAQCDLPVRVPT